MFAKKILIAGLVATAGLGLSACVDDGYGYGVGYASDSWDPYYGGYSGDPYWGWNGDYYYPGTGGYVYGRDNRRFRWNGSQRGYWQGRSQAWNNAHREMRPMWSDYGVQGGQRWQGRGGRPGGGVGGGGGRPGGGGGRRH